MAKSEIADKVYSKFVKPLSLLTIISGFIIPIALIYFNYIFEIFQGRKRICFNIALIIIGIISVYIGYGEFKKKKSAWIASFFLSFLYTLIILYCIPYFTTGPSETIFLRIFMIILAIIINVSYFLKSKGVFK